MSKREGNDSLEEERRVEKGPIEQAQQMEATKKLWDLQLLHSIHQLSSSFDLSLRYIHPIHNFPAIQKCSTPHSTKLTS